MLLQADKLVLSTSTSLLPSIAPALRLLRDAAAQIPPFLHTLYLFTKNDFLTFAIPTTLFAAFGALSGPELTTNASPDLIAILLRIPSALLVIWAKLLIFDISNQRSPSAVEEDKINKPHRPLPSGRITMDATRRLLLLGIPLVLLLSRVYGCWQETLLLFTAIWMYNDLQGCDEQWYLRNFFIAIGYGLYSSSALKVMAGPAHTINGKGMQWIGVITLVMFMTQHICDIKDAEGDKARGRKSAPIVLGDELVRWSVAVPVVVCSIGCPLFFRLRTFSYLSTTLVGLLVAVRTMKYRSLKADKLTWKLWALWTCCLFALPLIKDHAVFALAWKSLVDTFCAGGDCSSSLNLAAVSSVALAVEGRRMYNGMGIPTNKTVVPRIVIDGATL